MNNRRVAYFKYLTVVLVAALVLACTASQPVAPHQRIVVTMKAGIGGPLYQGNFYKGFLPLTDYVFWIEDNVGNYVKTLRISKGAVNVAKSGIHAGHLPVWQKVTGTTSTATVANDSLSYVLPPFDGLTSASLKLKAGTDTSLSIPWDLTDTAGREVPEGQYYLCIETASIRKDSIPGAGYVPAIIKSETTRSLLDTRRRRISPAPTTANIKSLTVSVIPLGGEQAVEVDGVSSATK